MTHWIGTATGHRIDYEQPDLSEITIEDIATALSKQVRFCGNVDEPYSTAQHSVEGSYRCDKALKFLLHDASEAWTNDCPTPLKNLLGDAWRTIEDRLQLAVYQKFGVDTELRDPVIKTTDRRMLFTERRDFQSHGADWGWAIEPYPERLECWPWQTARDRFLSRFDQLCALAA